jgi:hypothetical protein
MKVTTGTSGCNTTNPPGYSSYWGYNSGTRTNIPQFNQVWTPTIAGTYSISCGIRAYDDGYGACFWKDCSSGTNIQYGGNYYCPGPNNYVTVIVPQPVGCDPNSWTNCTKACGGGTQVNACGTPRNCNTQSCNPGWWQVKDGDVSSYGDLDSNVPSSYYFELSGPGGYPGIPGYGGDPEDTNLSSSNVSTVGWLANSTFTSTKVYDSTYFLNAIPATTTINNITATTFDQTKLNAGTVDSGGYTWFMYDGNSYGNTDLTVSALSLTTKKVILIVKNADIIIGGTIHLTKGAGFFLAISTGDINIANTVGGAGATPGDLEGIFVASGNVNTGTTGAQNDKQLWIRGSVISYGEADNTGINLQRDMGASNLTTPGEYFEFAPDLEILFPKVLSRYPSNWREVAP